jgi:hypothetical protein
MDTKSTTTSASRCFGWLRFARGGLAFLRRLLERRSQGEKSLDALAAIGEDDLHCLSESGQRLRREARRARRTSGWRAAGAGWLSTGAGLFVPATGLAAEQLCRPTLAIAQSRLSETDRATAERRWIARISVDASRCAANADGTFELVLLRLKENAPDLQFRERLQWSSPAVAAELPFSVDEAVERALIENVSPCACAR